MKVFNKIVKYILAIVLSIALTAYLILSIISSTILNKTYMIEKIEEIGYYDKIYEYTQSNFENYIQQSGFEKEILDGIVSKEKIKEDTKIMLRNMYDGIKEEISTESIKEKLNENINNDLGNRKLNESQQKSIDDFVDKICEEYKITILHFDYEDQINSGYSKIMKYVKTLNTVLIVTIAIDLVVILILHIRRFYRSLKYIGTSLMITGILCNIVKYFINANIKIKNILILNDAISETLINLIQNILNNIFKYGIITLCLGVIFTVISNIIYNNRKSEHEHKTHSDY